MHGVLCAVWTFSSLLGAPEVTTTRPDGETEPVSPIPVTAQPAEKDAVSQVGSCSSDADCDDADPCTTDTCVDGACENVAECSADADCDDFNVCTIDECIDGCCETRPQCFGRDDCPENHDCVYNCCSRCPGCHQILRVRTRCRRGHLRLAAVLRNEDCDGNTITIEVDGEPTECQVRGRIARCSVRRVRGAEARVCVTSPDCPEHCYDVQCGR